MRLFLGSTGSYSHTTQLTKSMVLFLLMLASKLNTAEAFQCYVCDSKDDIECTENLPDNSRLTAKDCKNITGAKYCVKTTNIYAGEGSI